MFNYKSIFCLLLFTIFLISSFSSTIEHELQFEKLNLTCKTSSECHPKIGNTSVCYEETCICDLGYRILNKNGNKCTKFWCDKLGPKNQTERPDTCWQHFKDSVCSLEKHICVCDRSTTVLDERSQECVAKKPEKGPHFNYGLLIGLLVLGALVIGGVAIYYTKIQRRRRGYN